MKKVTTKEMLRNDLEIAKSEVQKVGDSTIQNLDKREYFCDVAFVVFDRIADYEEFYSMFPNSVLGLFWLKVKRTLSCCFSSKLYGKDLKWFTSFKVERAPEPEDVIWGNLYFCDSERLRRKLKTYVYSFLLSIINLGIILGLNYAQVLFLIIFLFIFNI